MFLSARIQFQHVSHIIFPLVRNAYIHIFIIEKSPKLLPRRILIHYEKYKYVYYCIFAILFFIIYLLNLQICKAMTLSKSQEIVDTYTTRQKYVSPRLRLYDTGIIRAGWFS